MAVEHWVQILQMSPKNWTCGYCGLNVGGNRGYYLNDGLALHGFGDGRHANYASQPVPPEYVGDGVPRIFICPNCDRPSYFDQGKQTPGVAYGSKIDHLPPDVDSLYSTLKHAIA